MRLVIALLGSIALRASMGCVSPQVWVVAHPDASAELDAAWRVDRHAPAASAAERAAPHLDAARALALAFESERALEELARAQALLESEGRTEADFDQLHLVWAYRALIESNLEHPDEVESALREAARLRPDAELPPVAFPPDVRARYLELAAEARSRAPASRAFTSSPTGAQVLMNGREVGAAPITARGAPGRHHFLVRAPLRESRALSLSLELDAQTTHVDLPAASAADIAGQLYEFDDDELRAIADSLDADIVVRVRPTKTEGLNLNTGLNYRTETDATSATRVVEALTPSRTALRAGLAVLAVLVAGAIVTTALIVTHEEPPVFRIE